MEFIDTIGNIIKGAQVKKGQVVLLQFWGEDYSLNILRKFSYEVAKQGAIPLMWQHSRLYYKELFDSFKEFHEDSNEILSFPDKFYDVFSCCDVVIDIFMYTPVKPLDTFPKEELNMYKEYMGKLFEILSTKEKFIQVRVPTEENAEESGVPFHVYKSSVLNALSADMNEISKGALEVYNELITKEDFSIKTKAGILNINIKGREIIKDIGEGDVPCGEVYVAPVEDKSQGKILIDIANIDGRIFKDFILEFHQGRMINSSNKEFFDLVKSMPENSDVLAEYGVGVNPGASITGITFVDEKAKGTCHIALGANVMFGGKNNSPCHFDLIFTRLS